MVLLLVELYHYIRHLHIFFRLILDRHLEDDRLLVFRDGFLADCFYQLAQPADLSACLPSSIKGDLLHRISVLELARRIEVCVQKTDPRTQHHDI